MAEGRGKKCAAWLCKDDCFSTHSECTVWDNKPQITSLIINFAYRFPHCHTKENIQAGITHMYMNVHNYILS